MKTVKIPAIALKKGEVAIMNDFTLDSKKRIAEILKSVFPRHQRRSTGDAKYYGLNTWVTDSQDIGQYWDCWGDDSTRYKGTPKVLPENIVLENEEGYGQVLRQYSRKEEITTRCVTHTDLFGKTPVYETGEQKTGCVFNEEIDYAITLLRKNGIRPSLRDIADQFEEHGVITITVP